MYLVLIAEDGIKYSFSCIIYCVFGGVNRVMILAVAVLVNFIVALFTMGDAAACG